MKNYLALIPLPALIGVPVLGLTGAVVWYEWHKHQAQVAAEAATAAATAPVQASSPVSTPAPLPVSTISIPASVGSKSIMSVVLPMFAPATPQTATFKLTPPKVSAAPPASPKPAPSTKGQLQLATMQSMLSGADGSLLWSQYATAINGYQLAANYGVASLSPLIPGSPAMIKITADLLTLKSISSSVFSATQADATSAQSLARDIYNQYVSALKA
jgi:hypothetical protein